MIANDPKIVQLIEESELREFQKDLLKTHLETINAYIISMAANVNAMNNTREFADRLVEDNATKAVLLNSMLCLFYNRFTENEIEQIKKETSKCLMEGTD